MSHLVSFLRNLDVLIFKFFKAYGVITILIAGTLMVLHVPLHYLGMDLLTNRPIAADAFQPQIINNVLLGVHIIFAMPSIILGPFLFSVQIRKKYPKIHRMIGQVYVFCCLLSAVTVLPLAFVNNIGTPARYGFTCMSIVWFSTTYFAYTAAIQKDFVSHRRWAMRSYAVTFAFIHVNFTFHYLPIYYLASFSGIKVMQSMVSWLVNLFIVEIYLASTNPSGKYLGFQRHIKNLLSISPHDRFYFRILKKKQNP